MAVGEGDGLHPAVGEGYAVPHYRQLVAANRRVGLRRGVAPHMEGVVQRAVAADGVGQDVGGVGVGEEGVYSRQAPREAVLHYGVVARGAAVFPDCERHDGDAVGAMDVRQRQCLHSGVVEGQAVPHHRQLVAAEGAVYGVERVEPHVKVVVYSAVAACVVGHQVVDGGVGHEHLMSGEAPRQVVLHDGVVQRRLRVFQHREPHREKAVGPVAVGEGHILRACVAERHAVPCQRQLVAAEGAVGGVRHVVPHKRRQVHRAVAALCCREDHCRVEHQRSDGRVGGSRLGRGYQRLPVDDVRQLVLGEGDGHRGRLRTVYVQHVAHRAVAAVCRREVLDDLTVVGVRLSVEGVAVACRVVFRDVVLRVHRYHGGAVYGVAAGAYDPEEHRDRCVGDDVVGCMEPVCRVVDPLHAWAYHFAFLQGAVGGQQCGVEGQLPVEDIAVVAAVGVDDFHIPGAVERASHQRRQVLVGVVELPFGGDIAAVDAVTRPVGRAVDAAVARSVLVAAGGIVAPAVVPTNAGLVAASRAVAFVAVVGIVVGGAEVGAAADIAAAVVPRAVSRGHFVVAVAAASATPVHQARPLAVGAHHADVQVADVGVFHVHLHILDVLGRRHRCPRREAAEGQRGAVGATVGRTRHPVGQEGQLGMALGGHGQVEHHVEVAVVAELYRGVGVGADIRGQHESQELVALPLCRKGEKQA